MNDTPEMPPEGRSRVIVVTDPDTAEGFRLSGAQVRAFETTEAGVAEVVRLLHDSTVEAILANKEFLDAMDEAKKRAADDSTISVIELPAHGAKGGWLSQEELLRMKSRYKPSR